MSRYFVGGATLREALDEVAQAARQAVRGADLAGPHHGRRGPAGDDGVHRRRGRGDRQVPVRHGRRPLPRRPPQTARSPAATGLENDPQWPPFSEAAVAHGVHSVLSVPVVSRQEAVGALNFYARCPGAFAGDDAVQVGNQFASQMAIVLAQVPVLHRCRRRTGRSDRPGHHPAHPSLHQAAARRSRRGHLGGDEWDRPPRRHDLPGRPRAPRAHASSPGAPAGRPGDRRHHRRAGVPARAADGGPERRRRPGRHLDAAGRRRRATRRPVRGEPGHLRELPAPAGGPGRSGGRADRLQVAVRRRPEDGGAQSADDARRRASLGDRAAADVQRRAGGDRVRPGAGVRGGGGRVRLRGERRHPAPRRHGRHGPRPGGQPDGEPRRSPPTGWPAGGASTSRPPTG